MGEVVGLSSAALEQFGNIADVYRHAVLLNQSTSQVERMGISLCNVVSSPRSVDQYKLGYVDKIGLAYIALFSISRQDVSSPPGTQTNVCLKSGKGR